MSATLPRRAFAFVFAAVLIPLAWLVGPIWLRHRRRKYRSMGRVLTERERELLGRFYNEPVLACVRVAEVARVENPRVYGVLRALRLPRPLDLTGVAGMAFGDTAVITDVCGREDRLSVLFHELVHVVQYRTLGFRRFALEYVRGWVEAGGSYWDVPIESAAFEMQARFDADREDGFDVEGEVERRLKT